MKRTIKRKAIYKPRSVFARKSFKIAYYFQPVVIERLRSMARYSGVTQDALIATLIQREYWRLKARTDYEGIEFPTEDDLERNSE